MLRRLAFLLWILAVRTVVAGASEMSGTYAACGMTIRAVEGMPDAYVSLCGLLARDFDPTRHQEAAKQDQDRTARLTVQDDLVLSIVIEGAKGGSCYGTWTKADGLKVAADGASYTKKEKARIVTYRLSLDEERRLLVSVQVESSARDKTRKVGVYAFPRLSDAAGFK